MNNFFILIKTDEKATVCIAGGEKLSAKHLIIAIPPHQITRITFTPPLPASKTRIYSYMPAGHLIKIIVTYKKVN